MKTTKLMTLALVGLMVFGLVSNGYSQSNQTDAATTEKLAEEAYIYGLPILMSYKTMYSYSVKTGTSQFKAPFNQIKNTAHLYGPKDTAVVSANSDTPYSLLWMDLRAEPVVLCVPKIEKKRYFSVMLQDLSTNLLPYIGSRTTGNDGGCYMVTGADWKGSTPKGVSKVMTSQTDFLFAVYRTQLFDGKDIDNVKKIQTGYKVQTLSDYLGQKAPAAAAKIDFPAWDEKAATGNDFIHYLNFLLQYVSPDAKEKALWERFAKIGIAPGKAFDYKTLPAEKQQAIAAGIKTALAKIEKKGKAMALAGNTQAGYNGDWLERAGVTFMGWGANVSKEASYPQYNKDADGDQLDASKHNYTLTFPKDGLPPVNAFWSVTMYDGKTQLMIENPINRYLLNSQMLPDMTKNADGSLTLYLQKDSPGKDKESNWLPAPDGTFYMLMRLYWPKQEFLDGTWKQPAVRKAK